MKQFRLPVLLFTLLLSAILAATGLLRLHIDTDVIRALPAGNTVLGDALEIFANHPMLEQIAIDVTINRDAPDKLVACGIFIEDELRESGLFSQVGTEQFGELIPGLAMHIAGHLPILFSADELQDRIAPRLTRLAIEERLAELFTDLSSMAGIGQSEFIGLDPLGFKDPVLARLSLLSPSMSSRMYQGRLLSADGRHLLVTARPTTAGTNTKNARAIAELLKDISTRLADKNRFSDVTVHLTPVGAFRAALDNETIIRHDVNMAILLAMAGIGLLLLFSFSRPLIGLLSFLPALAGTGAALFAYSLLNSSLSIMVLGFGGAVISITVDHGIAYLLFLDRPRTTTGHEAATEVRAVGLMAVLTTIGAFLTLCFSGFPLFIELGQFTALGVLFSFVFVHTVFPYVFPELPPAPQKNYGLQNFANRCAQTGWTGFAAAGILALLLLFCAHPGFDVSLESMNTVSRETLEADQQFTKTWGSMGNRVFLMTTGPTVQELFDHDQQLLENLQDDRTTGVIKTAFVSSMLFPDDITALHNFQAWQTFWTAERVHNLHSLLDNYAEQLGFSKDAFSGLYSQLTSKQIHISPVEEKYYPLLGISQSRETGNLVRFITLEPGEQYNGAAFYEKYKEFGKIYDPSFFSEQLGRLLFATFAKILLILGISITVMLLLFYLSLPLTIITLLPVGFAYICTLGTLQLMGRTLDIPSLMLSIVILGMGVDYSIFFVRAHQRYQNLAHPSFGLVRMAVFMAAASTLIGFGVLAGARHSLLHSIGITCLLGIGYSLLGAFLLLPPILSRYFCPSGICPSTDFIKKILFRFRLLEPYPRMFARFKLKYDPLFTDLPAYLPEQDMVSHILDIGCGYGVPAAWCLEYFPTATITALDPDPERVRVASLAVGNRGTVFTGWATDIPAETAPADLILLLDMLHYIDDKGVQSLFDVCSQIANPGATLVIRYTVKPVGKLSLLWYLEQARIRLQKMSAYYRSPERIEAMLRDSGITIIKHKETRKNNELFLLKATIH